MTSSKSVSSSGFTTAEFVTPSGDSERPHVLAPQVANYLVESLLDLRKTQRLIDALDILRPDLAHFGIDPAAYEAQLQANLIKLWRQTHQLTAI